jgi:hypothetical protein
MTTQTRNEAAERLRSDMTWEDEGDALRFDLRLDEALDAERRATVERIRARLDPGVGGRVSQPYIRVLAILDEEAAR